MVIVIILGLGSRTGAGWLPDFISAHAGDTLWASMIYFGFRALFPRWRLIVLGGISLLFCFVIECTQLYQAGWINAVRNTTIGALVLGRGFLYADLARYSAGIALAALFDLLLMKLFRGKWMK
ncbi:DUF2809 domain-containing protein [Paenibacillus tarimensis]